ncbi:MAG: hypothetical protein ABI548_02345 [Polyangiaceae bacterium]
MKYFAAGLGLFSLCAVACSGSSNSKPSGASGSAGSFAGASGAAGATSTGGCTANEDCATGVCSDGTCQEVVCVPNTTYCANQAVSVCSPDGTLQGVTQHCAAGQYCLEKAGMASCSPTVCFPGDPMCVGNVATACQPDGSGPKTGGTDCAKSNQLCYAGLCSDQLCTPGQKLCDNGSLFLCAGNGTSRALVDTCASGQVCDAAQGKCVSKICDPGKMGCDSTRLVACNAAGSAWVQSGTDCADKQGVCVSGSCVAVVCTPGTKFCKSNTVYSCSYDGTSQTASQNCGNTEHCFEDLDYAYCNSLACSPGQPSCNGNLLSTCNADGSDWLPGGTDCSLTSAVCMDAQCTAAVCVPGELFCKNGSVQQCNDGLSYSQSQFCAQDTYCLKHGNVTDCAPTPCKADTDACAGEKLGHCASDGLTVAPTADCGAQGEVCALTGCAASAVDTVSAAKQIGTASSGEMIGDVILVHSARKLTTIEADVSMPQPRTLIWAVYEGTNADLNGEFDLKYQTSTSGTGAGFQSSGPISVQLEANKTYFIGVSASDAIVYYYDDLTSPPSLNFAHVIGGYDTSVSPLFDYENEFPYAYRLRLTTTAP